MGQFPSDFLGCSRPSAAGWWRRQIKRAGKRGRIGFTIPSFLVALGDGMVGGGGASVLFLLLLVA